MKKTLLLVLIFMISTFSPVIAQTEEQTNIILNWGANKPMSPDYFNVFWAVCWYNFGGGVETQLQENISAFGLVEFHKFNFIRRKGFPVEEVGPVQNIAYVSTYTATANLKYSFDIPQWDILGGYVYGGGGFMRVLPSLVDFANKIQWYYTEEDEAAADEDEPWIIAGEPIERYGADVYKFKDKKHWLAQAEKKLLGCAQAGFGITFAQEQGTVSFDIRYLVAFSEHELTTFLPIKISYWFPIR